MEIANNILIRNGKIYKQNGNYKLGYEMAEGGIKIKKIEKNPKKNSSLCYDIYIYPFTDYAVIYVNRMNCVLDESRNRKKYKGYVILKKEDFEVPLELIKKYKGGNKKWLK